MGLNTKNKPRTSLTDANDGTLPVQTASVARLLPLGDNSSSNGPILKEGETLPPGSPGRNILTNVISPGHFKTLQIPIVAGRDFDERDRKGAPRVVIVNERMAQMLWPGESAVVRTSHRANSPDSIEVAASSNGKYGPLPKIPNPLYYPCQRGSAA